jgi:hypothetical protein
VFLLYFRMTKSISNCSTTNRKRYIRPKLTSWRQSRYFQNFNAQRTTRPPQQCASKYEGLVQKATDRDDRLKLATFCTESISNESTTIAVRVGTTYQLLFSSSFQLPRTSRAPTRPCNDPVTYDVVLDAGAAVVYYTTYDY